KRRRPCACKVSTQPRPDEAKPAKSPVPRLVQSKWDSQSVPATSGQTIRDQAHIAPGNRAGRACEDHDPGRTRGRVDAHGFTVRLIASTASQFAGASTGWPVRTSTM